MGADTVLCHHRLIRPAARKNTAMNLRMQRLDAAGHHLGETGVIRDLGNRDACLRQQACRAARGENLDTSACKSRAKSAIPALSETLISARCILFIISFLMCCRSAVPGAIRDENPILYVVGAPSPARFATKTRSCML